MSRRGGGNSLALGLGLSNRQGAGIAGAFAGAADGWYYDFTDPGSLFQTTDTSTPVVAASNPIGRVNDKSPFGHHSTQPTSGARPTWQTSGGLIGAEFDGVDDFLTGGDVCDLRTSPCLWAVAAMKYNSSSDGSVFAKSVASAAAQRYGLFRESSTGGLVGFYHPASGQSLAVGIDNATSARILTFRLDRVAGTVKVHINRVQLGSGNFTPDSGSDTNSSYRFLHGAYSNAADNGIILPLAGRITASLGVFASVIDESRVRQVEQALAEKMSVALP